MNTFDVKSTTENIKKIAPQDQVHVYSCDEAAKATFEVDVEKVPHTFSNGLFEKVKSITVKVTLPEDFVLQGHEDLESEFAENVVETLISNIYGECEAQIDDMCDEEDDEDSEEPGDEATV